MQIKLQLTALYTLIIRELLRMFRIFTQVFIPPVITTGLYFMIFGSLIGARIGDIGGVDYATFIAPGLIMMTVILNSYGNVSTSLFTSRFQKSIEEVLVSPLRDGLMLLGYVFGGVIRGMIVALLVYLVSCFFVDIPIQHPFLTLLVILMVAAIFSLAGFTNAMVARNFEDVMIIPTFVLTPLTYLGGVFYSTNMLPGIWKTISHFNPILYMVNALRFSMIGQKEVSLAAALWITVAILMALVVLNLYMIRKGVGLRD